MKFALAVLVGIPSMLVGVFMTLTIIGAIVGVPLIILSGVPLSWVLQDRAVQKAELGLAKKKS